MIDLKEAATDPGSYEGLQLPEALEDHAGWLMAPLIHQHLIGFVVLGPSRAPRKLGWEDYDILKLTARQAASFLAERQVAQSLEEARQFEAFNRRFAFVLHDIKNFVSQLSLIGSNITKHGENPTFRDELVQTLAKTTAKMRRLMERMVEERPSLRPTETTALETLIERLAEVEDRAGAQLTVDASGQTQLAVNGNPDQLEAIVEHLVQNAREAAGPEGHVRLSFKRNAENAVVEIQDDGPGMGASFIRNELFRPFRTTKDGGFGLGAYQCREYARELGGDLAVESNPGEGTTMRLTLPLSRVWREDTSTSTVPDAP